MSCTSSNGQAGEGGRREHFASGPKLGETGCLPEKPYLNGPGDSVSLLRELLFNGG